MASRVIDPETLLRPAPQWFSEVHMVIRYVLHKNRDHSWYHEDLYQELWIAALKIMPRWDQAKGTLPQYLWKRLLFESKERIQSVKWRYSYSRKDRREMAKLGIPIDSGIPIPPTGREPLVDWHSVEIGQSFFVPCDHKDHASRRRNALKILAYRHWTPDTSRAAVVEEQGVWGVRVWRTTKEEGSP